MREDEKQKYLDRCGNVCFVCQETVSRDEMVLHKSTMELEFKMPPHAASEVSQYYMVCPSCNEKGELV